MSIGVYFQAPLEKQMGLHYPDILLQKTAENLFERLLLMKRTRPYPLLGILLVFLSLAGISACSGGRSLGTLALEPKYSEDQTLERLQRDWESYHIYYIGRFEDSPSAVVFDPKDDNRVLRQSGWTEATDSETLRNVVGWVRNTQISPRLHQVLGPEGHFYGYLYSAWDNHVVVRQVDEHTLAVHVQQVPVQF